MQRGKGVHLTCNVKGGRCCRREGEDALICHLPHALTSDFRSAGADVHVADATVRPFCPEPAEHFVHILGEEGRRQALGDAVVELDRLLEGAVFHDVEDGHEAFFVAQRDDRPTRQRSGSQQGGLSTGGSRSSGFLKGWEDRCWQRDDSRLDEISW